MAWGWIRGYVGAVRTQLRAAFAQDHPPRFIGASFAISVFVTTLPTLGTGVLVLVAIGYRYAWANRLALSAAVVVLNPVVKAGVYAASFAVGTFLLGPIPVGPADFERALAEGGRILVRVLIGNAVLAVVFALVGYVFAFYGARSIRRYRA
jgi:uncharacterized protein (DUF2062 family)